MTERVASSSSSKTVNDTLIGQHEHTIVGYSLIKGIGDGEPVASERFYVGGHEWVLLFYPDGKRSSSSEVHQLPIPHTAPVAAAPALPMAQQHLPQPPPTTAGTPGGFNDGSAVPAMLTDGSAPPPMYPGARVVLPATAPNVQPQHQHVPQPVAQLQLHQHRQPRRDNGSNTEYCALFVALLGEGKDPQGVVNTTEGKVVRAFHKFTLVDQRPPVGDRQPNHLVKGRTREDGAVKIMCARQDPSARNCHGYRKFVKKSVLEDPSRGFLMNDQIVIRYTIELVISQGGALACGKANSPKQELVPIPPPSLGADLALLLESAAHNGDVVFKVEDDAGLTEDFRAHRLILQSRSPVFEAALNDEMIEGKEGVIKVKDVKPEVFKILLYFVYTDMLPPPLASRAELDAELAQHLLAAADRYGMTRLRAICEKHLCSSVSEETVTTTLTLAELNNARELKRVCLEFLAKSPHLKDIMQTEGYAYMIESCPTLQSDIIATIALTRTSGADQRQSRVLVRPRDVLSDGDEDMGRRVRPRAARDVLRDLPL